jgi:hypothetical protein
MTPHETIMWAGPPPSAEIETDIDETLIEIMTSAGPLPAGEWEPEVHESETALWAGPLPPGAIEDAVATRF